MAKIDYLQLRIDRLVEVNRQIRLSVRLKEWDRIKELRKEKAALEFMINE